MLLTAVPVNADHAALEDAEEAFDRTGRHIATGILLGPVINHLMLGKLSADCGVHVACRPFCRVSKWE